MDADKLSVCICVHLWFEYLTAKTRQCVAEPALKTGFPSQVTGVGVPPVVATAVPSAPRKKREERENKHDY